MSGQVSAVDAVTGSCPREVYEGAEDRSGLWWDQLSEAWVAIQPYMVRTVLSHPGLAVRPPDAPVPPSLAGTPAGNVFSRLARMSDGDRHRERRAAVRATLDSVTPAQAADAARMVLDRLDGSLTLHDLQFAVPGMAVGALLGVPSEYWRKLVEWTAAFVRAAAPGASRADVDAANEAVSELTRLFGERMSAGALIPGLSEADRIANTIGILFQTHDATAGLVGGGFVALARNRDGDIGRALADVFRADAPVQNTRRWALSDLALGGHQVREGDMIITVLGGTAEDCRFGYGPHRCPGESIAMAIAWEMVRFGWENGMVPVETGSAVRYHLSGNARIPDLRGIMTPRGEQ